MTGIALYKKLNEAKDMNYPYKNGKVFFKDMVSSFGVDVAKEMARAYIDLMEEFRQSDDELDFIRQVRMAMRDA